MKRSVEVSGKSLEEVLERASRYFDVPREHLNYEVLSENKGFLGILVPRVVKVRVWVDDEEETPTATASQDYQISRASNPLSAPKEKTPANFTELEEAITGFLRGLFAKMQVEVEIAIREEAGSVVCTIDGKDAGVLIGKRGETLEAIEVVLRTFLSKKGLEAGSVELDIANYKKRREEALRKLAEKVAQKVIKEKKRVKLEPMNARERKIIHTTLKENPQVVTYSVGSEPVRRVVVELKGAQDGKSQGSEKKPKDAPSKSGHGARRSRGSRGKSRKSGGSKKTLEE